MTNQPAEQQGATCSSCGHNREHHIYSDWLDAPVCIGYYMECPCTDFKAAPSGGSDSQPAEQRCTCTGSDGWSHDRDCPAANVDAAPTAEADGWHKDVEFTAHGGTPMEAWVFRLNGQDIAVQQLPVALIDAIRAYASQQPDDSPQDVPADTVLREVEWSQRVDAGPKAFHWRCPICKGLKPHGKSIEGEDTHGHAPDCRLAAALRGGEG